LERAVSVGAEKMERLLGQSLDDTVDFPGDESYVPGENGPTI
jgi:hypothetical protein